MLKKFKQHSGYPVLINTKKMISIEPHESYDQEYYIICEYDKIYCVDLTDEEFNNLQKLII